MADQEVLDVLIQIKNQADLAAAKEQAKQLEAALVKLNREGKGNSVWAKMLAQNLVQTRQQMDQLTAAATRAQTASLQGMSRVAAGADAIGQSTRKSTRGLQNFANTLDDLQYVPEQGLRPILNNFAQFAPALAIAGIAVDQFIRHWDDISQAFGAESKTLTEAERWEKLAKAIHRTAEEELQYNQMKAQRAAGSASLSAADSLSLAPGTLQAEAGKRAKDAIEMQGGDEGSGFDKIMRGLERGGADKFINQFMSTAEKKELEAAKEGLERAKKMAEAVYNSPGAPASSVWIASNAVNEAQQRYGVAQSARVKAIYGDENDPSRMSLKRLVSDPTVLGQSHNIRNFRNAIHDNRDALKAEGVDVDRLMGALQGPKDVEREREAAAVKAVGEGIADLFGKITEGVQKAAQKADEETKKSSKKLEKEVADRQNAIGPNRDTKKEVDRIKKEDEKRQAEHDAKVRQVSDDRTQAFIQRTGGLGNVTAYLTQAQLYARSRGADEQQAGIYAQEQAQAQLQKELMNPARYGHFGVRRLGEAEAGSMAAKMVAQAFPDSQESADQIQQKLAQSNVSLGEQVAALKQQMAEAVRVGVPARMVRRGRR